MGFSLLSGGANLVGGILADGIQGKGADEFWNRASYKPYDVNSAFGSASFDGTTANAKLGAAYQPFRDQLLGMSGGFLNEASLFDPQAFAQKYSGMLGQIAAPGERQQRQGMENRLFQQGLLGSTGGASQMRGLFDSQNQAGLMRDVSSMQLGQQLQDSLFSRGLQGLQGAIGVDQLPMNMLSLGGELGSARSGANATAAQPGWQRALNRSDAVSDFFGGLF